MGVVKWWNVTTGSMPRVTQTLAQPAVMRERSLGDLAVSRLDAAPFDREPVIVQPETRDQFDVLLPPFP